MKGVERQAIKIHIKRKSDHKWHFSLGALLQAVGEIKKEQLTANSLALSCGGVCVRACAHARVVGYYIS